MYICDKNAFLSLFEFLARIYTVYSNVEMLIYISHTYITISLLAKRIFFVISANLLPLLLQKSDTATYTFFV